MRWLRVGVGVNERDERAGVKGKQGRTEEGGKGQEKERIHREAVAKR